MVPMTPRRAFLALAAALALGGCIRSDEATPAPSPSSTVSVRPTIAAAVPNGVISAKLNPKSGADVATLIGRLNALPGVLGAGYFSDEARLIVRLKPDATPAQIEGVIAGVRREASLFDIAFEPPESPSSSASPAASATPRPAGESSSSPATA